jgi:hypothetical protein
MHLLAHYSHRHHVVVKSGTRSAPKANCPAGHCVGLNLWGPGQRQAESNSPVYRDKQDCCFG